MRIGIDCRTILSTETGELAGTAHYTTELVQHLLALDKNNTYVLFFDARVRTIGYYSGLTTVIYDNWITEHCEIVFLPGLRMPMLTTHIHLARALTRAKLDLFHSPAHPLPLFYRGRMVWTVHDLAIYDHPEWFPGGLRRWFSTRFTVPRGIRRATKLIAPSESTKRDIMRIFNVPEEKIRVIYEGASKKIRNPKSEILNKFKIQNSKFFLFIGTIEPRKNLVRLLEAFIRFRLEKIPFVKMIRPDQIDERGFSLILAGGRGWRNDDVFMAIERANLKLGKGSVQYLGYVSEEEKIALLQNATAFVWPSLYEGFGLPVLEAMAAGVPVITSNVSSIPEVTGDAAMLVNPESVAEITTAMERVVKDVQLAEQLKTRGLARAKGFTWEKTAKETLAVYRDAMSRQTAG